MPKSYHIAPQQSERLNSILHRAVQDGVAPAISLAVTNSSQSMYEQQVGALTFDPLSPACHSNVYFQMSLFSWKIRKYLCNVHIRERVS